MSILLFFCCSDVREFKIPINEFWLFPLKFYTQGSLTLHSRMSITSLNVAPHVLWCFIQKFQFNVPLGLGHGVLVSLSVWAASNKVDRVVYKQQNFHSFEGLKSEIRVPLWAGSDESPLPVCILSIVTF